jgi:hypothetical protein
LHRKKYYLKNLEWIYKKTKHRNFLYEQFIKQHKYKNLDDNEYSLVKLNEDHVIKSLRSLSHRASPMFV